MLADRLADGHRARHPGAFVELATGIRRSRAVRRMKCGARTRIAGLPLAVAQRGYDHIDEVVPDSVTASAPFEAAVDAMLGGDIDRFTALLDDDPELARLPSHWPHRGTLLHYATANGVETYRQVVPLNLPDMITTLLDHGADVNATAHAYGAERRPIGLLLSSAHPRDAGVIDEAERILRSAGAR